MTGIFHGGDLSAASAEFGEPAGGWVDLSTGINPRPWPVEADVLEGLRRLPDTAGLISLMGAAKGAYGAGQEEFVVAAPGTQALIQWLPRLRAPCRVAILSPTYSEHAAAWRLAGHDVMEVACLPDADAYDAVVVTNPNNPDGNRIDRDKLQELAAALATRNGLLVVDEAFADLDDIPSVAAAGGEGLVALRSFGKFYGLPGLRLGFAVAAPGLARDLTAALGPWPVSTMAAEIGAAALSNRAWQAETRRWLADTAHRLDGVLRNAGFDIAGGTDLFRLGRRTGATAIFETLARAGIYVRPFPENPDWLRFGLPGTEAHWARLEKALSA